MPKVMRISDDFKCRVCGSRNNIRLLFQSDKRQTVHMLTTLANITVKHDDPLPKCICNGCIVKLTEGYNFKMLCEKSDREHRRRLGLPEPRVFRQDKNIIEPDEPGAVLASLYECRRCKLCFSNALSLQKHFATHGTFNCRFCAQRFISLGTVQKHEKSHMKCGITSANTESLRSRKKYHDSLEKPASVPEIVNVTVPEKNPSLAQFPLVQVPLKQPPMAQPPMAQPPMAQTPMAQPSMAQSPMAQPPVAQPPIAQPPMAQPPIAQLPMDSLRRHKKYHASLEKPVSVPEIVNVTVPQKNPPMTQFCLVQIPLKQPPMAQPPMPQHPMAQSPMEQPPVTQPSLTRLPNAQPPLPQLPMAQPTLAQPPIAQPPTAQPPLAPPPLVPVGLPIAIQKAFSKVPAVVQVALSAKVPTGVVQSVGATKPVTMALTIPTASDNNERKRNYQGHFTSNVRLVPPLATNTTIRANLPSPRMLLSQTRPVFILANQTIVTTSPVNVTAKNPMLLKRVQKYKCNFCDLFFDRLSELNVHQVEHIHKNNLELCANLKPVKKQPTPNASKPLKAQSISKDSVKTSEIPDGSNEDLIEEFKEEILYDESEYDQPYGSNANASEFNENAEIKEEVLCSHSPSAEVIEITHESSDSYEMVGDQNIVNNHNIVSNRDIADSTEGSGNTQYVNQKEPESLENMQLEPLVDLTNDKEFENELLSLCETLPDI